MYKKEYGIVVRRNPDHPFGLKAKLCYMLERRLIPSHHHGEPIEAEAQDEYEAVGHLVKQFHDLSCFQGLAEIVARHGETTVSFQELGRHVCGLPDDERAIDVSLYLDTNWPRAEWVA